MTDYKGITQKEFLELFDYRDGILFWKVSLNESIIIGSRAGCENENEHNRYRTVGIYGKQFLEHRIIFLMHKGYLPEFIDHNKGESNKIENLRECTSSQNAMNRNNRLDNTSGYKGVSWSDIRQKWIAQVRSKGLTFINRGFDCIEEANLEAIKARKISSKKFANHG